MESQLELRGGAEARQPRKGIGTRDLRLKTLVVIFILIFVVLVIAGIGTGDLNEILFNGRML